MSEEGLKKRVEVKFPKKTPSAPAHPPGSETDEDSFADYSGSVCDISERDDHFLFLLSATAIHAHKQPMFESSTPSSTAKSINHGTNTRLPAVDLSKLGMDSLVRYCREYNISGIDSNSTKEQMLGAVQRHFVSQPPLDEEQVIRELLTRLAKEAKNKNSKQEKIKNIKQEL